MTSVRSYRVSSTNWSVNGIRGKVGCSANMDGFPTNQALGQERRLSAGWHQRPNPKERISHSLETKTKDKSFTRIRTNRRVNQDDRPYRWDLAASDRQDCRRLLSAHVPDRITGFFHS